MYAFLEAHVADYMTRAVVTVSPETTLRDLERLFTEHDFNSFPVVRGQVMIGAVTKFDILKQFVFTTRHVIPLYEEISRRAAGEIMTRDVLTFASDRPLTKVLQTLVDFRVKSFPVVDAGRLVGIIAREDVVRALRDAGLPGGYHRP